MQLLMGAATARAAGGKGTENDESFNQVQGKLNANNGSNFVDLLADAGNNRPNALKFGRDVYQNAQSNQPMDWASLFSR